MFLFPLFKTLLMHFPTTLPYPCWKDKLMSPQPKSTPPLHSPQKLQWAGEADWPISQPPLAPGKTTWVMLTFPLWKTSRVKLFPRQQAELLQQAVQLRAASLCPIRQVYLVMGPSVRFLFQGVDLLFILFFYFTVRSTVNSFALLAWILTELYLLNYI